MILLRKGESLWENAEDFPKSKQKRIKTRHNKTIRHMCENKPQKGKRNENAQHQKIKNGTVLQISTRTKPRFELQQKTGFDSRNSIRIWNLWESGLRKEWDHSGKISPIVKGYTLQWDSLCIWDDLLTLKWKIPISDKLVIRRYFQKHAHQNC